MCVSEFQSPLQEKRKYGKFSEFLNQYFFIFFKDAVSVRIFPNTEAVAKSQQKELLWVYITNRRD